MNRAKIFKKTDKRSTQFECTNCGQHGHTFKQCLSPVTSHGVILFRVLPSWNPTKVLCESETAITGFEGCQKIEFLLIQRKDSLGFVEIMRGKYKLTDYDYIFRQLSGMTKRERERILTLSFQELWDNLWGIDHANYQYRSEKENSRLKFESLIANGITNPTTGELCSIRDLFDKLGPGWDTPEWGFPKGRRDPYETEKACALREMWEETGISIEHVHLIENMEPIQETFFGTNNIHYSHKYRIVFVPNTLEVSFDPENEHMKREIGGLGWFPLEEAVQKIRPDNVEKREVLFRVSSLFRNFCPFALRSL